MYESLIRAGYAPIPLEPNSKIPAIKDWQRLIPSRAVPRDEPHDPRVSIISPAIAATWPSTCGVGVACGSGLVCVDVDSDALIPEAVKILPPTVAVRGAKGFKAFYRGDYRSVDFRLPDRTAILQILGAGRQAAIPPSVHPGTGRAYSWYNPWGGPVHALGPVQWGQLPELPVMARHGLERLAVRHGCADPLLALAKRLALPETDPADTAHIAANQGRYAAYAKAALRDEITELADTARGGRNAALFEASAALARFIAHGLIAEPDVTAALREACTANGLIVEDGEASFDATVNSGFRTGRDNPIERIIPNGVELFAGRPAVLPAGASPVPLTGPVPGPVHYRIFDSKLPPAEPELIKGVLPYAPGDPAVLGGQSGAGKSFVALELAVCLVSGKPFLGRKVNETVGVVYIAAESAGTIALRLHAAVAEKGLLGGELPIAVINWGEDLCVSENSERLIVAINDALHEMIRRKLCKRVGLVIIDTLAAAFGIVDENSNSEAGRVTRIIRDIGVRTGTVPMFVHHHGKSQGSGLRGASAWQGNVEAVISVLMEKNEVSGAIRRRVEIGKTKGDSPGWHCYFDLKTVQFGMDLYGDPRTTGVVIKSDGEFAPVKKQSEAMTAFERSFDALAPHGPVELPRLKTEFMSRYSPSKFYDDPKKATDAKRKAWERAWKEAQENDYRHKDEIVSKLSKEQKMFENHPPIVPDGAITYETIH